MHHLVGVHEAADRLGVGRQRLYQLIAAYPDFPPPAAVLRAGKVWHTADIEAWAAAHPDRGPGTRITRDTEPTP